MERFAPRELRTDRDGLRLVPLVAAHVAAGYAQVAASREQLAPWLAWARASTLDGYAEFVHGCERRAQTGNPFAAYALMFQGEFAGQIDAHDYNAADRIGSIGYWLGTAYSGRGLMTSAVIALTRDIFERAIVDRLEIYVARGNDRSCRVAERAGYTFEAMLESRLAIGDERADASLYASVRTR